MQFIVLVDGAIVGQIDVADHAALDRLLLDFPSAILKTPAQMIEEGWR
jgi:hypothetical protein